MQYTRILLASALFFIAASPLSAQTKTGSAMKAFPATGKVEAPALKSDSERIAPAPKAAVAAPAMPAPAKTVPNSAAVPTPVQNSMLASNLSLNEKGYSKVPLAGEKAYFGDKN